VATSSLQPCNWANRPAVSTRGQANLDLYSIMRQNPTPWPYAGGPAVAYIGGPAHLSTTQRRPRLPLASPAAVNRVPLPVTPLESQSGLRSATSRGRLLPGSAWPLDRARRSLLTVSWLITGRLRRGRPRQCRWRAGRGCRGHGRILSATFGRGQARGHVKLCKARAPVRRILRYLICDRYSDPLPGEEAGSGYHGPPRITELHQGQQLAMSAGAGTL
jgi:hypothetical protein